jgi:hypothetical protein
VHVSHVWVAYGCNPSYMGTCRGTWKLVVPWGQIGNWVFIALFVLPEDRDVQTDVSWEGEVSPWPPFGTFCSLSFNVTN